MDITMPSRAEFLAGLIQASDRQDDDCSFCYSTLTDAVVLPCSHIFDRECINTCPACRLTLFDQEDLTVEQESMEFRLAEPGSQAHRALLRRTLRMSGLQEDRSEQSTSMPSFGFGRFTKSVIFNASVAVAQYLSRRAGPTEQGDLFLDTRTGEREVVRGLALVDVTNELLCRLIAFIHLMPALAASGNRPYDEQKLQDWERLMILLKLELSGINGEYCDVDLLLQQLRITLQARFRDHGGNQVDTPFLMNHVATGEMNLARFDFDLVLDYGAYFCWKE